MSRCSRFASGLHVPEQVIQYTACFKGHPLCPEETERRSRSLPDGAKQQLAQIYKHFFRHIREYVEYQWQLRSATMANEEAAVKVAIKILSKKFKQQQQAAAAGSETDRAAKAHLTESANELAQLMSQSQRASAGRATLYAGASMAAAHGFVDAVCRSLSDLDGGSIDVMAVSVQPVDLLLQVGHNYLR